MKKVFLLLTLSLAFFIQPALAENYKLDNTVRAMSENYARYQLESGLSSGQTKKAPLNTVVFVPTFNYSHNSALTGLNGAKLNSSGGTTKSTGFALVAKRLITDSISLSFKYEYTHSRYSGSSMHPEPLRTAGGVLSFDSATKQKVNSHAFLLAAEKDFDVWGRLSFAVIQSFNAYSGTESLSANMGGQALPTDRRSVDSRGRVTALGLTYVKPFQLSPSVTLSPYLGLALTYVHLEKLNDFSSNIRDKHMNSNAWGRDLYTGLTLDYRAGLWSASLRGGITQNVGKHPIGGFMVRNIGPELTLAGFNVGADKSAATFGAAVSYVIPGTAILSLNYNGMAGSRTVGHAASFAVIVPF